MHRFTWYALGALLIGLLIGAALSASGSAAHPQVVAVLEPIGTVWVNAVRMTIIPLVFSMLVVAVASSESLSAMGRMGGAMFGFFVATLATIVLYCATLGPILFGGLDIAPEAAAALRATAESSSQRVGETVRSMGGFAERFIELVPANPIGAAASGAMLPLVVFGVIFGAALSRLAAERRATIIQFFSAVAEAMHIVVEWVFLTAPLGVFALAVVVGARLGISAVGAVAWYVGVFVVLMLAAMVLMFAAAVVIGGVPLRRFTLAMTPSLVIALGTRSSSAALPAQLHSAREILGLPPQVISFVLPTAVAILRVSAPVSFIVGALFLGKLYGVPVEGPQMVTLGLLAIILSFSVPPVPSGSVFLMAPVFADIGIPVEGIAILIAIDAIPDLAKTLANVSAHQASAVVVTRLTRPARALT